VDRTVWNSFQFLPELQDVIVYGAGVRLAQLSARNNEVGVLNKRLKSFALAAVQVTSLLSRVTSILLKSTTMPSKLIGFYRVQAAGVTQGHANPRRKFPGAKGFGHGGGTEDNDRY
jgi:hypothetical protein